MSPIPEYLRERNECALFEQDRSNNYSGLDYETDATGYATEGRGLARAGGHRRHRGARSTEVNSVISIAPLFVMKNVSRAES